MYDAAEDERKTESGEFGPYPGPHTPDQVRAEYDAFTWKHIHLPGRRNSFIPMVVDQYEFLRASLRPEERQEWEGAIEKLYANLEADEALEVDFDQTRTTRTR